MENIKKIIDSIANTNSRNEKESILNQHRDNQLLKDILYFVFSPYVLTGISKKKISKKTSVIASDKMFKSIIDVMDYLKIHNSGRDFDIAFVQTFIKSQPEELQELYTKIITKDLVIGLSEDTINKVFDNYIEVFDVMLAKKFEEHKDKIKGDFVITEKLDGNRIVVVKDNGVVKSFTRTGKQYEGLEEIESDIANLPLDNIVLDGELIADTEGSTHDIYTETTSKARSKGSNKTGLLFYIFDRLSLDDFKSGKSRENAVVRKHLLSKLFEGYTLPHCKEVKPLYIGSDLSQIDVWMEYASSQGWEGLMVNLDKPYVCKRSDYILKVKTMSTCDLKVIGFEEGTGRNEGKLGALIVDYKGYACGVGSGFSDQDREYIWNNQEKYLGKIIETQFFEESKNAQGGLSLRFPVYKKLRLDKTKPSYY